MDKQSALDRFSTVTSRFSKDLAAGKSLDVIRNSPNYSSLVYTYLHRKIIFDLGDKLGIPAREFYYSHDLDKLLAYQYLSVEEVHDLHVTLAAHHDIVADDPLVLTEMVLDWESARFTKPDKPLNAFDTLYKYYASMESQVLPILQKYGLDKHTDFTEAITSASYDSLASEVSPLDILADIINSYTM